MTTTNSIYQIKESEIAYVIQALDDAFMYLETNCDGMSTEALYDSMGIMHNLRSSDSGERYWTPPVIQRVTDVGDTDYFD